VRLQELGLIHVSQVVRDLTRPKMNLPNSIRVDAQVLALLRGTPVSEVPQPQEEQNVATPGSKLSPPSKAPGAKCRHPQEQNVAALERDDLKSESSRESAISRARDRASLRYGSEVSGFASLIGTASEVFQ
jgi:hypothetical protein